MNFVMKEPVERPKPIDTKERIPAKEKPEPL